MTDELRLLVAAATDTADQIGTADDYRREWVHIGKGVIYGVTALAVAVDRFVTVVKPPEET